MVARVARPEADGRDVQRSVEAARWLASQDVPAVLALDVVQPVNAAGLLVTFWRSLGDGEAYGSTGDLAQLLRRLHALVPPAELELARVDPLQRGRTRLASAPIGPQDREFLVQRLEDLADAWKGLSFHLPVGVIHDDASVGNVLIDDAGTARLIDLDGLCIGPREWDLIQTAIYYDRFGWHTHEEYETFCETYGYDVMAWPGYQVMADARELLMVTWIAKNADKDQRTADEVAKRIMTLRTGGSRRDWQPY